MTALPAQTLFDSVNSPTRGLAFGKTLRLLRLTYRQFKGISEFALDSDGDNVRVYGDNATGKTTLFDGFLWLLFDKDSQNRKDFQIKTLDDAGEPLHGLDHEVEGSFDLDGATVLLRKVYSEKWVKTRGSAERTFSGHETAYFIDGVPKKKQEYDAFIQSIVEERIFRLLTDPGYFNEQLKWDERRRILLEVCGDVSDAEVIASDERLEGLTAMLGSRNLDDHRSVLASRRTKMNKELQQIPVRISEVKRGIPDISGLDPERTIQELRDTRAIRDEQLAELARAEQGGGVAELTVRLNGVRSRMLDHEMTAKRSREEAISEHRRALQDAQNASRDAESAMGRHEEAAALKESEADGMDATLEALRERWMTVDEQALEYSPELICPVCRQVLPESMVDEARQTALEDFNKQKAETLERIDSEGRTLKERQTRLRAEAIKLRNESVIARKRMLDARARAAKLQSMVDRVSSETSLVDPEYHRLAAERDTLETQIAELKAGSTEVLTSLRQQIASQNATIATLERSQARILQYRQAEARIAELESQEKALAAQWEQSEHELFLTEEFIRTKVRLLDERINSRFTYARFKLFDVQVNGAIVECCETLYQGVPYGTNLNRGARMNVGLDIIDTLSEHYGFRAPIWIDNREAVTKLIPVHTQVVSLIVSAQDKTLRVVRED